MGAEYLTECLVEQVGTRVVGRTCSMLLLVDLGAECGSRVCREFLCYVDREIVLLLCVDDLDALLAAYKEACVAYLTSAFCIEWSLLEDNLVECLVLLLCLAVAQYCCAVLCIVIADKCTVTLVHCYPVAVLHGSSVACACLLLEHLLVELCHVHSEAVLAQDKLCEVNGESVCVVEGERLDSVDFAVAGTLCSCDDLVKHLHACGKRAEE